MLSKLKLPFAVGYAKQTKFLWDNNTLQNSFGVQSNNGWACARYGVKVSNFHQNHSANLTHVWQVDNGILEFGEDCQLLLKTNTTYSAIDDEYFSYVKVVPTSNGQIILTDISTLFLPNGHSRAVRLTTPVFENGINYKRRLFAITGMDSTLHFSAFDDQTCFDHNQGAGSITFDKKGGKCLALCVIGQKLCVFRQYSIEQIDVTASQSDFVVRSLPFNCGNLYPNTVASDGVRAIFLTDKGLCSFDGKSIKRVATRLDKTFATNNQFAFATWCKFGYVLNCKVDLGESKIGCENGYYNKNALIVVSGDDVVVLRGWDFSQLVNTNDNNLIMLSGGVVYDLIEDANSLPRQCSLTTNFNSHKGKTVQFVTFFTSSPVKLTVRFNNTCKTFDVQPTTQPHSVFVNATGKNFKFVFEGNGAMDISPITVDYLLYNGGVAP